MNVIIAHKSCMDGYAAAYCASKYFEHDCIVHYLQYDDPIPDVTVEDDVYILDFSFKREMCLDLEKKVKSLTVIDHHKTAQEELKDLPFAIFDMTKSGAVLAWEYFFPNQSVPPLLLYIQDRDLWQWKLENSEEINLGLTTTQFILFEQFELHLYEPKLLYPKGSAIKEYRDSLIKNLVEKSKIENFNGEYQVPTINSPFFQSEIGNELCKKYPDCPFAVIYFDTDPLTRVYSLRSIGDFDVSEVAKQFGGGGHKNAAGFAIKVEYENS